MGSRSIYINAHMRCVVGSQSNSDCMAPARCTIIAIDRHLQSSLPSRLCNLSPSSLTHIAFL